MACISIHKMDCFYIMDKTTSSMTLVEDKEALERSM